MTGYNYCGQRLTVPTIAAFWAKVDRRQNNKCWSWNGGRTGDGYGALQVDGKLTLAHRFSFFLHSGKLPKGKLICHKCDNPPCVNPEHLFAGTHSDNITDCFNKGRGALNGRKITDAQVLGIRAQVAAGYSQREIGEQFGVTQSLVSLISRGKIWRNINQ